MRSDDDLEVQLAHPADDRLPRLRVRAHAERRVLLRELRERDAHLVLIGLCSRLDRDRDHGLREIHLLESVIGFLGSVERVAGRDVLEPDGRGDVARSNLLDLRPLVRMHLQRTGRRARCGPDRVVDRVAGATGRPSRRGRT